MKFRYSWRTTDKPTTITIIYAIYDPHKNVRVSRR